MLIDLLLVAALGGLLWWPHRREPGVVKPRALDVWRRTRSYVTALRRSRFGLLLALMAGIAVLRWGAFFAERGLDVAAPFEASERQQCHAWQQKVRSEGKDRFLPFELACPAGGGAYVTHPDGEVECPAHGVAP